MATATADTATATTDTPSLHDRLVALAAAYHHTELELAELLAAMQRTRGFAARGYGTLGAYAEKELKLDARKARTLALVGRKAPELPAFREAFARGDLSWTQARALMKVLTPEVEEAWVARAAEITVNTLERLVAAGSRGQLPPDPSDELPPSRTCIRFGIDAQDADVVRAAIELVRTRTGLSRDEVDDGAILAELARHVLATDETGAAPTGERFRVVLQTCPDCAHTTGVDAEVDETHVGHACCDAEVMDVRPGPTQGHLSRTIPPTTRRLALHRDGYCCQVPGCTNRLYLDLHHLAYFARGGGHHLDNLITLCSLHHRVLHAGDLAVDPLRDGRVEFRFKHGRVAHIRLGERATRRSCGAPLQAVIGSPPSTPPAESASRTVEPPNRPLA